MPTPCMHVAKGQSLLNSGVQIHELNDVRLFHLFARFDRRARAACFAICRRRFALSFFSRAVAPFPPSLLRSSGSISIASPFSPGRLPISQMGLSPIRSPLLIDGRLKLPNWLVRQDTYLFGRSEALVGNCIGSNRRRHRNVRHCAIQSGRRLTESVGSIRLIRLRRQIRLHRFLYRLDRYRPPCNADR
jgi:hypothetical protein